MRTHDVNDELDRGVRELRDTVHPDALREGEDE